MEEHYLQISKVSKLLEWKEEGLKNEKWKKKAVVYREEQ